MLSSYTLITFIVSICIISLMDASQNYFKMKHRAQFMTMNQIVNPPLDCNYVTIPLYYIYGQEDEYNITDTGTIHFTASPIDVCFTEYWSFTEHVDLEDPSNSDSAALNPASIKFVCDNNTLLVLMWFGQDTCDGAVSYNVTADFYTAEYKCDAATSCDYVVAEQYPSNPSEPCEDGVVPSGISPASRPYVVDTCFSNSIGSIFISGCDSSGNIIREFYTQSGCNGSLAGTAIFPPSPGICNDDDHLVRNLECVTTTTTISTTAISTTAAATTTTVGTTTSATTTTSPTVIITTFDETSDDSDDYSSDSDGDSDSRDDMFAAVANGALLEEKEEAVHYNLEIKFSDATLINVYGLFAVFVLVNVFICCVCCRRKTDQKKVSQLQSEDAFP